MNKYQMIRDYILFVLAGQTVDAMQARNDMNKRWDILWDWHEFSNVLDNLRSHDKVEFVGHHRGGMTMYRIPTPIRSDSYKEVE